MHCELRRAGELEEDLDRKGARARAYTEDLIARGEFPPQGWHWAIRVELLDSERDWAWIAQHRKGTRVHAGTDRKKHPVGLGGRHQLTYKHACVAAVAGGRGESPPECGQEIILFSKGLTRRNIYIESGSVFLKGEGSPSKGDSDSPIEDKFEREADLTPGEAERSKSDEGLGDYNRNCLWDYSPKTHRE